MPGKDIKISDKIKYISILNENGELDKALEPDISEGLLLRRYRTMLLSRNFDERLLSLQRQGRIGTFPHPTLSETEGEAAEIFLGSATHILSKSSNS